MHPFRFYFPVVVCGLVVVLARPGQCSPESQRDLRNAVHFFSVENYEKSRRYFLAVLNEGTPREQALARRYLARPELSRRAPRRLLSTRQQAALFLRRGIALYKQGKYGDAANYFVSAAALGDAQQQATANAYLDRPEMRSGWDELLTRKPEAPAPPAASEASSPMIFSGYVRNESAVRLDAPRRLTLMRSLGFASVTGKFSDWASYRVSGRAYYDAVFALTHQYPQNVREDQQQEATLRDTYVDLSGGPWDARIGKQQIVWGEAIGFFYADRVNAKDLRESVLPAYDFIRIPQWGTDVEYTRDNYHLEYVWLPIPAFNKLPVPGSEFFTPLPTINGRQILLNPEFQPGNRLENGETGGRASYRADGWDMSVFELYTWDKDPDFVRTIEGPYIVLSPTHRRIAYTGATISKELDAVVLRGEFVYTRGKYLSSSDLSISDGLVRKDVIEYELGAEHTFSDGVDLNVEASQRIIPQYQSDLLTEKATRTSLSIGVQKNFWNDRLVPALQAITDWPYHDGLARPSLGFRFGTHWRLTVGADFFGGAQDGPFGQFTGKSRAYSELRYDF